MTPLEISNRAEALRIGMSLEYMRNREAMGTLTAEEMITHIPTAHYKTILEYAYKHLISEVAKE